MAKFSGEIGFAQETVESPTGSGKWVDQIVEFPYFGDVVKNTVRRQDAEKQNSDIVLSNSISIVADEYVTLHIQAMRYIKWAGAYWTISTIEVQRPRLLINLGDIYNGPKAEV